MTVGDDEKECPSCAEVIRAKAVRCRFCGHEMELAPAAALPPPQPFRSWLWGRPSIRFVIVMAVILVLLAIMTQPPAPTGSIDAAAATASAPGAAPTPAAPATVEAPIAVTAAELWRAYDANEAAAQAKYGDHVLRVTGVVDKIDLDFLDNPIVDLKTGSEFDQAHAGLASSARTLAKNLSKGQRVMLECQGTSEVMGDPALHECIFVGPPDV